MQGDEGKFVSLGCFPEILILFAIFYVSRRILFVAWSWRAVAWLVLCVAWRSHGVLEVNSEIHVIFALRCCGSVLRCVPRCSGILLGCSGIVLRCCRIVPRCSGTVEGMQAYRNCRPATPPKLLSPEGWPCVKVVDT